MQIKVKETKIHQKGNDTLPVAEGQFLLVECEAIDAKFGLTSPEFESKLLHRLEWKVEAYKWYSPIIISTTEKIEKGDSILLKSGKIVTAVEDCGTIGYIRGPAFRYFREGDYKILVLPRHFSEEYLQAIVDGEMMERDKILVECEKHYFDSKGDELMWHVDGLVDESKTFNNVKFNSQDHATLHKEEEKLVPISLLQKAFKAGEMYCATEGKVYKRSLNFEEWSHQNIK